ncbi:hypothetical protein Taro_010385 [Colocasia esculenta]|uniref:Uncharacterized protein n=1 Tax=Colocasia esculenta TaxID=4460 RepID=A0A843UCU7_COLES|nr:hypothetical protein [Colocasia esculenta]
MARRHCGIAGWTDGGRRGGRCSRLVPLRYTWKKVRTESIRSPVRQGFAASWNPPPPLQMTLGGCHDKEGNRIRQGCRDLKRGGHGRRDYLRGNFEAISS